MFRKFPFLVVVAIIGIPVSVLIASGVADRLGYCVTEVLPGSTGLNTGAYVQNVGSDHATILWRTAGDREGSLEVTDQEGTISRLEMESDKIHEVPLTDLEPGTTYEWKVESGLETHEGEFTTAPDENGAVRFAVLGDSGTGSKAQYDIAAQVELAAPDAVLHTGDVVYQRGALCHYGARYFAPYETLIATTPVFPVLGNHDVRASNGQAYFETFSLPANNPSGTEEYYSFDFGPVHVVAVDSELYGRSSQEEINAQIEWLKADLAATDLPWTIVMLHKPPFSSTDGKQSNSMQEALTPIFAEAGVDLVLAGHAHNYERTKPIDGVLYIVTGGGGADLYSLGASEFTAVAEKKHHFVQIDVTPSELTITAIDREGEAFDTMTLVQ